MNSPTWFKLKAYPHIGYPLTPKDSPKTCAYIRNPKKIATHPFCPFIHKEIKTPKYRKQYDPQGNLLNNGKRKYMKPKFRDIYFANHVDANIFSYYSFLLARKYENELKKRKLSEVVTAYRKIPLNTNKNETNKCNIDFANDVFNYIRENSQSNDLIAITFDITGFFDNLDHKYLRECWYKIWGVKDKDGHLPKDHYNVFKAITKFSYIEEQELFNLFKDKIIVKTKSGITKSKPVKKISYLRDQNALAYCELKDLHKIRARGLIYSNKYQKSLNRLRESGICQGSPISATLANIYMLEFDDYINQKILEMDGIYRRYSDDMVVVCHNKYKDEIINLFQKEIIQRCMLSIQPDKTQVFHFMKQANQLTCLQEFDGVINHNSSKRKFEYLGFSFDGNNVYLKTSVLAKYYRKMKTGVRRRAYYTNRINNDTRGEMFIKCLYKQYSYVGAKPSKSFYRVKGTTNRWVESKRNNWGNFIGYAQKANRRITNNKIKYQIKNHWKILNMQISRY